MVSRPGWQHRDRCDLYHSALQVYVPEGPFVIEQAPASGDGSRRGVVAEGAVGARALGRFRLFRYEVRSGATASSPTSRGRREPDPPQRRPERAPGYSSWCRRCRRPSGAATSSAPARCGTRTRRSHGSSRGAGSTSTRSRSSARASPGLARRRGGRAPRVAVTDRRRSPAGAVPAFLLGRQAEEDRGEAHDDEVEPTRSHRRPRSRRSTERRRCAGRDVEQVVHGRRLRCMTSHSPPAPFRFAAEKGLS